MLEVTQIGKEDHPSVVTRKYGVSLLPYLQGITWWDNKKRRYSRSYKIIAIILTIRLVFGIKKVALDCQEC